MFAVAPMPAFSPTTWATHRPSHSSPLASSPIRGTTPLSPTSGNSVHRNALSSPPGPSSSSMPFKFSARPTKPNPVLRGREEGQAARRTLFLKNVRSRADDQKWARRSIEGHAVRNWYEEERELARMKERDQTAMFSEADIEEADVLARQRDEPAEDVDEMMVDDIARQEELELDALLSSFEERPAPEAGEAPLPQRGSSYFSEDDDADYDAIFMELIQNEAQDATQEPDKMEMC